MSKNNYNQLGNIQSAISTLRRYNQYLLFSVDENTFDNPLLVDYFEKPLDDGIEGKVEKVLSVAAVKTVIDNLNIPQERKVKVAIKNASDLREAMRYAKLEYHLEVKKTISVQEYNRRKRAIPLVRRVARLEQIKKYATNISIRLIINAVAGHNVAIAVGVIQLVWRFLPDNVRNSLVMKSKKICDKAIVTLKNYLKKVKSTAIGQRIGTVVNLAERKIMPKIQPIYEKVKAKIQQVKDIAKSRLICDEEGI